MAATPFYELAQQQITISKVETIMDSSTPVIRLALPQEISLLPSIQLRAAIRFPESVLPEPMRSTYTVPQPIIENAINEGRAWVALIEEQSDPVGYCVLRDAINFVVLEQVDVLPEYGRRGIGRLLVETAIEKATAMGHSRLYLTTFNSVPWNAPFYTRLGFRVASDHELPLEMQETIKNERFVVKNRIAMLLELPAAV